MRCRTAERDPRGAEALEALAGALAERTEAPAPRSIGRPAPAVTRAWDADLAQAHGCLLEAGGQIDDALREGELPLLLAADPAIALGTLPAVATARPDAKVLWLDAHGSFHTPQSTPDGYLGGMALAGACGEWSSGLPGERLAPARAVLCGVRELGEGERERLPAAGATVIGTTLEALVFLQNALDGAAVHVHLDPDVLDSQAIAVARPSAGGLSVEKLYDLLDAVADGCEIVGLEVCAPASVEGAELLADLVMPLLA